MIEFLPGEPQPFGTVLHEERFESTHDERTRVLDAVVVLLLDRGLIEPGFQGKSRLCLDEALVNAVEHGNQADPDKVVRLQLFADDRHWGVIVADQGSGFAPEHLPNYEDPVFLETSEGGRGLMLLDALMDRVGYYGRGNVLMMVKRRPDLADDTDKGAGAADGDEPAGAASR